MARKYDFISELYNRTCKTVVANPASWEAFLRSACYNYRLRFDEQLLVHAQRPDATAVLQIDDWNQKFGRWVNRGAHGIAVFEDADQRRQRLVHYFDISDTHPSRFSRRVPIWQMRDEYTAEVIDTLESTFGELNDKETLAVAIESAARNAVEDNIPDYLTDLLYSVKDSFLDGVSEEEITHIFKTAVRNSVAYMTMTRLGIEAGEYFEPDDLRDVVNFTTPATLNALGYAIPVPTDEAVREAESRLLGVETNATNWQRRQNANNNFSAQLPYDIEQQRKEMKEFLDDLTTRDQRMMFAVLTMVHTADTKEQLDNDTEALLTTARKHLCQFGILKFQQLDGLNTAMPFGVRKIESFRTLTTESLAVFIPFRVQDICHTNGVYYGQNVISKNMIIADRRQLLNGNEFILGVSGGGKSFTAKNEIINQMLSGDSDILLIDPEREYTPLVRALGGEIINISATSPTHINAMDMNREYGDGANPVILKSEFIMSLCEQLIGGNNLGAVQKSIIDRCTASVYRTYQQNNYTGEVPTLQDFRAELLKQSEPEAQEIALAIELFTNGSLNTFAKKTNVNTDNRLICYDILDLGKQLMPIGMLVVLDSILNRITQNRAKGKNTFIFIDEIYLLFQHEYSANFLFTLWKRVRKYGAYATGITQNVDDLLQSHTARTMLANSEFIVMLNQASTDRLELAKLLNISDTQLSYITNVDAGHGLIKVGSSLVPFANKFPKNTKLYKLMTTKPGEGA